MERHIGWVAIISTLLGLGCGPNEAILRSNSNADRTGPSVAATPAARYESVDAEIENMRTADFDFIIVLRRRDGGTMQADDKTFVRNTTPGSNRRSLVDGDRAIVIGTNTVMTGEVVKRLSERFDVQDFSKPMPAAANASPTVNANM